MAELRQAEVLASRGQSEAKAARTTGVTPFTYNPWRKEFGDRKTDQLKRLEELEKDRAIAALSVRARGRGSGCARPWPT